MRETLVAAKNGADRIGADFTEPDDDWEPVMLVLAGDGDLVPCLIADAFQDEATKELLFSAVVPEILGSLRATEAAVVTSMWFAMARPGDVIDGRYIADHARPANRDDRMEALAISWAHANGDSKTIMAQIHRHEGKPPTLEWGLEEKWAEEWGVPIEEVGVTSRIADALAAGVR